LKTSLEVKLEIYEGPLDLLLHLIKKNEVDINDIPIALITSQYLEYLKLMESLNIELAGEFLVMAATLTQIKSKLLLPSPDEEAGLEEEDPRLAIIRPLLEYMKIKDAAGLLERREILNRDVFARGVSPEETGFENREELLSVSLFDLIDSFRLLIQKKQPDTGLQIILETQNIEDRIAEIISRMKETPELSFEDLFVHYRHRRELILTFLALLELVRLGWLRLFQHSLTKKITVFYLNKPGSDMELNPAAKAAGGDINSGAESPITAFHKGRAT